MGPSTQLFDAEVERARPITDIKLLVENSERILKDDHENILVSCSFTSSDALTGIVTGGGRPLPKVDVIVKRDGNVTSVKTGDSGSFVIPSLDPGSYTVIVNKDGFVQVRRDIQVREGSQVAFNVNLEDVAIRLLLTALSQVTNNS